MTASSEISTFLNDSDYGVKTSLRETAQLRARVEQVAVGVTLVDFAVQIVDEAGDVSGRLKQAIDNALVSLEISGKAPGIVGTTSRLLEDVLETVRPVLDRIERTVDRLNGTKDRNDDDTGMLEALSEVLGEIGDGLVDRAVALEDKEEDLADLVQTLELFSAALARSQAAAFDNSFAALDTAVAAQFSQRNAAGDASESGFADVLGKFTGLNTILQAARLEAARTAAVGLDAIDDVLDALSVPLEIANTLLSPIKPVFDAIGFVFDLLVEPVMSFLTAKLGIDRLLDEVADKVREQLPPGSALEGLLEEGQGILDQLRDLRDTNFGLTDYETHLENLYFGNVVGDAQQGPTGIGTNGIDLITGDDGVDIIDARIGRDVINAGGGNDIIIASVGVDTVDGGSGTDMVFFDGSVGEFEFYREGEDDDGPIIVTHMLPQRGKLNFGTERLENVEFAVFNDFTIDLSGVIIGGSVLDGTGEDDFMLLNSGGTTVGGFHVANGLAGDDTILGSTQDDRLNGGSGDDVLIPGAGDDIANGNGHAAAGDTFQILDSGRNNGVRISLTDGTSFSTFGRDTLEGIENVIVQQGGQHLITGDANDNALLGSDDADTIGGGAGDDTIDGGQDDDVLIAGSGADVIAAGEGRDVLISGGVARAGESDFYDGGLGSDLLSYAGREITEFRNVDVAFSPQFQAGLRTGEASGPVRIFGAEGRIENLDAAGNVISTDTAVGIENFMGSNGNDTVYGVQTTRDTRTAIYGAGGDDVLYADGSAGVYGGAGDDTLVASAERSFAGNVFDGGGGIDALDLGEVGDARWSFRLEGAISRTVRAFDTSFTGNLGNAGNSFYSASVSGVELFELGDFNDYVYFRPGGASLGQFRAGAGDDRIDALNGEVIFFGGAGNDTGTFETHGQFMGEAGEDYLTWDSGGSTASTANMGAGSDHLNLERFLGAVNGGGGVDILSFNRNFEAAVEVDLAQGTAFSEARRGNSVSTVDAEVANFEHIIGSALGDTVRGSDAEEILTGRGGNDLINGRRGNDRLFGGDGNDTVSGGIGGDLLHGGGGNDRLDGGSGSDTASYATATPDDADGGLIAGNFGGVTVDLQSNNATGAHGTDVLVSIENIFGSAGADRISGNAGDNALSGAEGNDTLSGRAGNDVLITGRGTDRVDGGAGNDTVLIDAGTKVINGGAGLDILDLSSADGGVVVSLADTSFDVAFTQATPVWADDGTTGIRRFDGQDLTPQLVREASARNANSTDDLARRLPDDDDTAFGTFTIADERQTALATVTLTAVEGLSAGIGNDVLTGNAAANALNGRTGDDRLLGQGGDDTLEGGDGRDTLNGGDGNDNLRGGTSADDLRDVLLGGAGRDRLDGGHGNDLAYGGDGADVLIGGFGADDLQGQNGNDSLSGGALGDLLFGGAGADFLNGGFGFDRMNGGGGADDFFHLGIADHGSDWIQDYDSGEGDTLVFGGNARAGQFQVNFAHTATPQGERSGADNAAEAFVIYRPTEQIIWALVDGRAQNEINIEVGGQIFDLL